MVQAVLEKDEGEGHMGDGLEGVSLEAGRPV